MKMYWVLKSKSYLDKTRAKTFIRSREWQRTKIRWVMIREKSFCQIILQNLTKISTEVYMIKPFEIAILVKFNFEGQNSCFKKLHYWSKIIIEKMYKDIWHGQCVRDIQIFHMGLRGKRSYFEEGSWLIKEFNKDWLKWKRRLNLTY